MKDIDQKLDILYDLIVDNFDVLETELKELIANPQKIKNTNKFASLLSDLKNITFIDPLIATISKSNIGDPWLTDFLYAAINLLDEVDYENDEFDVPDNLIDKLRIWILDNKGEIAWKAANLLKFYESEKAEEIQLKKLEERGDFHLTYLECILGLLRNNEEKHKALVKQIAEDETRNPTLRKYLQDIV